MRPSEVESPMCTTDRHADRAGPLAAVRPGCLLPAGSDRPGVPVDLDGDGVPADLGAVGVPAASAAGAGCTIPVRPAQAMPHTTTAPARATLVRRRAAPSW